MLLTEIVMKYGWPSVKSKCSSSADTPQFSRISENGMISS